MAKIRAAVLWSGGKNSALALMKARKKFKIVCLISIIPKNKFSFMYHASDINVVKKQAEALSLPAIIEHTTGKKELELFELRKAILEAKKKHKIRAVVDGIINSEYKRIRLNNIAKSLGLESISPVWNMDQEKCVKEAIKSKIKAIVTNIRSQGFGRDDLGSELDNKFLKRLKILNQKHYINIAGCGAEYETLVPDAPFFRTKIMIKNYEKKMDDRHTGRLIINKIRLISK